MAAAKQIDLTFSADASLADVVNGDTGRLQQVIGNVLTNAIKFTPEGGRVDVSVKHVRSQMEVKVVDTGRGISADFLHTCSKRFRQAVRPTSRQQGGLGLAWPSSGSSSSCTEAPFMRPVRGRGAEHIHDPPADSHRRRSSAAMVCARRTAIRGLDGLTETALTAAR